MVSPVLLLFVGSFPGQEGERNQGENTARLCCRWSLEEKRGLAHHLGSCSEASQTHAMSTSSP